MMASKSAVQGSGIIAGPELLSVGNKLSREDVMAVVVLTGLPGEKIEI